MLRDILSGGRDKCFSLHYLPLSTLTDTLPEELSLNDRIATSSNNQHASHFDKGFSYLNPSSNIQKSVSEPVERITDEETQKKLDISVAIERRKQAVNMIAKLYSEQINRLKFCLILETNEYLKSVARDRLFLGGSSGLFSSTSENLRWKHNFLCTAQQRRCRTGYDVDGYPDDDDILSVGESEDSDSFKEGSTVEVKPRKKRVVVKLTSEAMEKLKNSSTTCVYDGCGAPSLPLSSYCYAHVVSDPKQTLFKGCEFSNLDGKRCDFPIPFHYEIPLRLLIDLIAHEDLYLEEQENNENGHFGNSSRGNTSSRKRKLSTDYSQDSEDSSKRVKRASKEKPITPKIDDAIPCQTAEEAAKLLELTRRKLELLEKRKMLMEKRLSLQKIQ